MEKKTNALVPAAAILVLLCAAYGPIIWQQKKSGESSQRQEEEQIYMTDVKGISSLSWEKDEQGLSFGKESGTWYYQTDRDCPIRQYTLSTLADTLSKLRAERCLDTPDSLASYGLDTPSVRLETRSKDGTARTILVGSQVAGTGDTAPGHASTAARYCACAKGSDQVYTIGNYLADTAGKRLYDFVETEPLPYVTGADIRETTVTEEGETSHLLKKTIDGEDNIAWYKDSADREENRLPDNAVLGNLVQAIGGLSIQSCTTYKATDEELGSFGLPASVMTLSWTYERDEDSGTVTLAIGNPGDEGIGYYTRKDDSRTINLIFEEAAERCPNTVFPE